MRVDLGSIDRAYKAELKVVRLTEENDIQRASIQELSQKVAKLQKVADAAKELIFVSQECEKCPCDSDCFILNCDICPYNSEVKINDLGKALAELENNSGFTAEDDKPIEYYPVEE